jgi:peptidoglycan hydrolase-like protein with peptidoglycan-binding domain
MNTTSRITATALATLLAAGPVAALAQPNAPDPGSTTAQPQGTAGETEQTPHLSQATLQDVQQQLQQQGFYKNAKIDGKWGPHTRQAVQSFQQAKGLPATGQLDEQTLGALGVKSQGG